MRTSAANVLEIKNSEEINKSFERLQACIDSIQEILTDPQEKVPHVLTETLFDRRIVASARRKNAKTVGELKEKAVVGRLIEALSDAEVDQSIHYPISEAIGKLE